jgi:hypothetical protein
MQQVKRGSPSQANQRLSQIAGERSGIHLSLPFSQQRHQRGVSLLGQREPAGFSASRSTSWRTIIAVTVAPVTPTHLPFRAAGVNS